MSMIYNAQSGMLAAQAALDTASQNIANLDTPGYSRQAAVLVTQSPSVGSLLNPGSGVDVAAIRRFNDEYKNFLLWEATAAEAKLSAARPYFSQLEQVMNNKGTSLSVGLDEFYSALNAVSREVTDLPLRSQVISKADALAQRVNNLNHVFTSQRAAINEYRSAMVSQINTLSATIAELNSKISKADASLEVNVSALLDERDRQIGALSAFVDVSVILQADGSKMVGLRGGPALVLGEFAATLTTQLTGNGVQTLTLQFATEQLPLSAYDIGGQLGGANQYERNVLNPMVASINVLAEGLATRVNDQLRSGYDREGNAGVPLFEFNAASPSGILKITDIMPDSLAFAGDGSLPFNPASNDNLVKVINIQKQTITLPGVGDVTMGDAYAQLIGRLATNSQQNKVSLDAAKVVRGEAEKNWKSTSGVNRDEEAVNLMEFYKMYQANMKVFAVSNQLFDSMLAIV